MTKRGLFLLVVVMCGIAPSAFAQKAARTILLVRHGAYQSDPKDPSPGPGLLPVGVAQAKLAASRLAAMGKFDAVLSSPMTRAHETARVIAAEVSNGALQIVPELHECTPATRRKEITKDESVESMAKCTAQLDALFAQRFVPAAGSPRREILVAHGNVIRSMVVRALGVDPEAWLEMSVAHASITEILVEPDGRFKVISVGDAGHLPLNLQSGVTGVSDKSLAVPR
ncbi:MAG TPA: histidine phosphatase family protein [Thermoanaerobaculia bacterium]|nr:histidine phosphatase family protein [Thermoanaerobaculia bacterium]